MARFRELSSEKLTSIAERSLKQSALTDKDHLYLGSYPFILKHFAALRFDRTKTDSDVSPSASGQAQTNLPAMFGDVSRYIYTLEEIRRVLHRGFEEIDQPLSRDAAGREICNVRSRPSLKVVGTFQIRLVGELCLRSGSLDRQQETTEP